MAAAAKGGRLLDAGQVTVEFDHVPGLPSLLARKPKTITVVYPIREGQGSPDRLQFVGFAVSEGATESQVGNRMTTKVTFALTGSITFIPGDPPISNASVSPVLEKVFAETNGTFTALLGYYSRNTVPVVVPIQNNRFDPQPWDRGQPKTFLPGRHYGVIEVNWTAGNLVWTLVGPDGRGRTATAAPGVAVPRRCKA